MIYLPCKRCGGEHASVLRMTREQWVERGDLEVTDRCLKKQRVTAYGFRDTVWQETQ